MTVCRVSLVEFGPRGFKQVLLRSRSGSYLEFSSPNRGTVHSWSLPAGLSGLRAFRAVEV